MNEVALIIIYNHRYDVNIERLEAIYGERFSSIYHLVPFYDGTKPNVIAVYESSHYFQGYVAQGLSTYFDDRFEHYFFIGDDLLLNPAINEKNYKECLQLDDHASFIPGLINLHEADRGWARVGEAFEWTPATAGVEAGKELPGNDEALKRFKHHGLSIAPLSYTQLFNAPKKPSLMQVKERLHYYKAAADRKYAMDQQYHLSYPLIGAYSDIFVIPSSIIKKFCHYCGVFAATRLFVELAIPTAMVLASEKIVEEKVLAYRGRPLWTKEDYEILDKYQYSLEKLLKEFPDNYLYIHPVKLSKWK